MSPSTGEAKFIHTDTVSKRSSTQHRECLTGNLGNKRDAVLDDFPSIPEIDLLTFIKSFLPPLPPGVNLQSIFLSLRDSRGSQRIRGLKEGYYWDVFATEPAKSTDAEGATFDKLMEIYRAVIETASISRAGRTAKLCLNPNKALFSDRTYDTRPDGYIILMRPSITSQVKDPWEDLAIPIEFQKTNSESARIDNMKKQIFSMQQLMTYDPCRRFTFGLTIENTEVRFWFCSRSMLAVSAMFDLNRHPTYLIIAFLSFSYASKADLGWDETMKPKIIGGEKRYEIKVGNNTYETQGVAISDFMAHSIVGRATRVYKVKKLQDDTGRIHVLKDVWVAKDRRPEHTIRKEILESIEEVLGKDDKKKVEKHLFTSADHCIVQVETNEGWVDDDTHDVILRKAEFSTSNRINVMHMVTNLTHVVHTTDYQSNCAKDIIHRYHYRSVSKELAVPLYDLKQVSLIFYLFYEMVQVLHIFHRAGWVHRDLSVGNVFLYQNECFKLGDLEFAKKIGKDGEHDVRIGTLDFMACEVERQEYLYLPGAGPSFFYHNSLHELESVWWLVTWCLFFHRPFESAPEDPTGQKNALDALFPRQLNDMNRSLLFGLDGKFAKFIQYLHSDVCGLGTEVDTLRVSLMAAYSSFETCLVEPDALMHVTDKFSQNHLGGIHDAFKSKFEEIWTRYKANDIKLIRLYGSVKRERLETEELPEAKRYKSNWDAADETQMRLLGL